MGAAGEGTTPAQDVATAGGVSGAQFAVHWREEESYNPPVTFVAQANAADPAIRERFSEERFPECFKEYADLLTWDAYWRTTLDTSNPPFWKWFVGGRLNASFNCVDRHLASSRNNGELIDHKAKADEAVTVAREQGLEVDKVLVWRRQRGEYGSKSPMVEGRDFFVDELLADHRDELVEPVSMPA